MSPTTWDGHVRIDYLPDLRRLQVTLVTVEATREDRVRRGLRTAFVTDDPDGPPAFVAADLPAAFLPADLGELLGPTVAAAARLAIADEPHVRWARLDLAEVDSLAAAWAPYRALVLADRTQPDREAGRVGAWAGGLWARLGVDELRERIAGLGGGLEPAVRGDPFDDSADDPFDDPVDAPEERPAPAVQGTWTLPDRLAAEARISRVLEWSAVGGLVTVTARAASTGAAGPIAVAFDDGASEWSALVPTSDGVLTAVIATAADPAVLPAIRVRAGGPR